jgi:hypothetical protein
VQIQWQWNLQKDASIEVPTVMLLRIQVFWDVTSEGKCFLMFQGIKLPSGSSNSRWIPIFILLGLLDNLIPWNTANTSPSNTASRARRPQSSATLLWEPQISQLCILFTSFTPFPTCRSNTQTTCHLHAWIGTPLRNHSTFSLGSPTGIRRASKWTAWFSATLMSLMGWVNTGAWVTISSCTVCRW